MRRFLLSSAVVFSLAASPLSAAPRDALWKEAEEAGKKDQPKTEMAVLRKIQTAAFAEEAWGEGCRALARRVVLQGMIEGGPEIALKTLDKELPDVPAPARPILTALQANWFFAYYQQHRWRFAQRSATAEAPGDDIETWDLSRILAEITNRFEKALAARDHLARIPVADYADLFTEGSLDDRYRPTLYDFIAHQALTFHSLDEVAASRPQDAFEVEAESPALDDAAAFLAWQPKPAQESPHLKTVLLLADLMRLHQADEDPSAFLHVDLRRIRWAADAAVGKQVGARADAALRRFIKEHAGHELSAWARETLAERLISADKQPAAHRLASAGADAFPNSPFGKLCANVVTRLEQRELELATEAHWTPAGARLRTTFRNIDRVWFRLLPADFDPGKETLNQDPLPKSNKAVAALLNNRKPVLAWDLALPNKGDYRRGVLGSDAPVAGLPPGYYLLVASGREDFSLGDNALAVQGIHVGGLSLLAGDGTRGAGVRGLVTDAVTGAPLKGITVEAWSDRDILPGTSRVKATTDADGRFQLKPGKHGRRLIVASRGKERAVCRTWDGGSDREPPKREAVVFFTDRALYRPGQTVHYKGIWLEHHAPSNHCVSLAERKGEVIFRDPNGKEITRTGIVTNQRGGFSGTFTAPTGSVLGSCSISVDNRGSARVQVEEYKRPKFFVSVPPPAEQASLGEQVTVEGKAEAYTGAAIDGAQVEWRVTRRTRFPPWLRYCWWCPIPSSPDQEIAHGSTTTAEDGSFDITFSALPDRSVPEDTEPVFVYEITADVTDTTGETRSGQASTNLAYTSLRATLSASDWISAGEETAFTITTTSHDGKPRAARGTLKFHRLKEPDAATRPDPTGGDNPGANPDQWKPDEPIHTARFTTDKKEGRTVVKHALPAGIYRLVATTRDAGGRKIQALLGIQVVNPRASDFPTPVPFHVVLPSRTVEPGDEAEVVWGSGYPQARALVEWFHNGKRVGSRWSPPDRTQEAFRFPLEEKHRGGIHVRVTQLTGNILETRTLGVDVPWSNKQLTLTWEHLTDKLQPGAKDTWTAVITGPDGEAAAAEMVATLYDASLDAYLPHHFRGVERFFRHDQSPGGWRAHACRVGHLHKYTAWGAGPFFNFGNPWRAWKPGLANAFSRARMRRGKAGGIAFAGAVADAATPMPVAPAASMKMESAPVDAFAARANGDMLGERGEKKKDAADRRPNLDAVTARENLDETAFFFPHLMADDDGTVRMTFTMPEALTTWKFLGYAHDAHLATGLLTGETVTTKDLMVQPNPPRFLREGDDLCFTVKISNQSESEQTGAARLTLADARTGDDATDALGVSQPEQDFTIAAKTSKTLSWRLQVPDGAGFLTYKAVASTATLSDGEIGMLPVLPRRVLVTESMALPIRDAGSRDFTFDKLRNSGASNTLTHQFLDVQVVSQPAWYAVMALPYLMEFPHECSEQTFNRYYANALATKIARSDPKIRRVFNQWKGTDSLDSPLQKNEDIKGIMLEETPWLRQGENEAESRRRVGLLFDEDHMARELGRALEKLRGMQRADGLWPWFPGGRGNEYITLYITTGFARLRHLGVETDITPALKALPALDRMLRKRYEDIREDGPEALEKNHLTPWVAHHLYTRSFFLKDKVLEGGDRAAFDYFLAQAEKYWTSLGNRMSRGHAALALHRTGRNETAKLITRSLREHAVVDEEQGMWWKDEAGEGWWWWQAGVETQAMMIEAFREIDGSDQVVEDCRVWLLKQKQAQDWESTKATADAVYALLLGGAENLLASDALIEVTLGGQTIEPAKVEAGTGFYQHRFGRSEVAPRQGNITLEKTDKGVGWASVHWQYFEDMAKVTAHQGKELRLEKNLFVRKNTGEGPKLVAVKGPVSVGDELVVRLVLRNDRAMEFVHLKDHRGSGTEPVNVLSRYKSQDGLYYYEVTRDTASHFFIDWLPAGTHVFEYAVRVQHVGAYQTGWAEIRCMYAPEFNSHSQSLPLTVEKP